MFALGDYGTKIMIEEVFYLVLSYLIFSFLFFFIYTYWKVFSFYQVTNLLLLLCLLVSMRLMEVSLLNDLEYFEVDL